MVDREIEIRGEVMFKRLLLSLLLVGAALCSASLAFAQIGPPASQRITQQLIINSQQVPGVMVTENGAVQSYTCPSPQPYVTVDQSSSGWACFDQATGAWLMNAQPPPQQQSATVYSEPPVTVYTEHRRYMAIMDILLIPIRIPTIPMVILLSSMVLLYSASGLGSGTAFTAMVTSRTATSDMDLHTGRLYMDRSVTGLLDMDSRDMDSRDMGRWGTVRLAATWEEASATEEVLAAIWEEGIDKFCL
jgi:hypothetical protein